MIPAEGGVRAIVMSLTKVIIHPIRSFREDLRTNPLSRYAWGIEPFNRRRRRRAWIAFLLPSLSYLILVFLFLFGVLPGYLSDLRLFESVYGAAVIVFVFILLSRGLRTGLAIKLQANWSDYYLAGLTGRQILWGSDAPRLAGDIALAILNLLLTVVTVICYALVVGWNDGILLLVPVVCVSPSLLGICAAMLDAALWPFISLRLMRIVLLSLAGVLTSPFLIIIFCLSVHPEEAVLLEIVSWAIRLPLIVWLWRRAELKVEPVRTAGTPNQEMPRLS